VRAIMPSLAEQEVCIDCHNALQTLEPPWKLGDMMGGLVIDRHAAPTLARIRKEPVLLGALMLLLCYGIGVGFYSLAARAQRVRAKVERQAQNRMIDVIKSLSGGIAIFDSNNRLAMVNPAFERMHARMTDLLQTGTPFETILREQVRRGRLDLGNEEPENCIARALGRYRKLRGSIESKLSSGRWEQVREQRLDDGGMYEVVLDITEEKDREVTLRAAKDAAETTNQAKSEFLANMSRELRTPLNAIIGFAEIIQSKLFGSEASTHYTTYGKDILDSARYLRDIINDVLDMSKIEAGRYALELPEVSLPELVEACQKLVAGRLETGQVTLGVAIDTSLPPIFADPRALKQILLNLLSNAVKFTLAAERVDIVARLS